MIDLEISALITTLRKSLPNSSDPLADPEALGELIALVYIYFHDDDEIASALGRPSAEKFAEEFAQLVAAAHARNEAQITSA